MAWLSPGVAGSIGNEPADSAGADVSWSVLPLGGIETVSISVPGIKGDVEAEVRVVDPQRSNLDDVGVSLAVGDVMSVEIVSGDTVDIRVDYVLVEHEVSDSPGALVAANAWLPRFKDGDITIVGREVGRNGTDEHSGRTLRLTTYGHRVSVELWGPQRVQTLEADDRGVHRVVERVAGPAVNLDGPGSVLEESALNRETVTAELVATFAMPSSSTRYVDVLVASSNDSEAVWPDSALRARQIVAELNLVTTGNLIGAEFRLVGVYETNTTLPVNGNGDVDAQDLLDDLRDVTKPLFDDVRAARDLANADVVVQLTGPLWDPPTQQFIAGLAGVVDPSSAGGKANAFTIFVADQPVLSAVHEVGHLFGARHDVFVSPSSTPFAFGHGYVKQLTTQGSTLAFNTVMAYTNDPLCDTDGDGNTDDCQRLKLWSDPGLGWGDAVTADVARVVDEQTPAVSAFEPTFAQRLYRASTGDWFFDANDNGNWDGCGTDLCRGPYGMGVNFKGVLHPEGHLGYFDRNTGVWHFDADDDEIVDACGGGDLCYGPFGVGNDFPFITGDGKIGTFNAGTWRFDANGNGLWNGCAADECATFGQAFDQPVLTPAGDIGVYRKSTGEWFFDTNSDLVWSGCGTDTCLGPFGGLGDRPVVTVDGQIGLFRPSTGQWFFDLNGDGLWNGCGVDRCVGNMGAFTDWAVDAVGSVTLP